MAYAGTTSTSPNPPRLVGQAMAESAGRSWVYVSTHTAATVEAANFFTDGDELGLKVGDTMLVVGSTTYTVTAHAVIAVGATTTNLSTGISYSS